MQTNKTLLAISLSLSLISSVASAQASKSDLHVKIVKPFTSTQTFCEVNRFTGKKREYTIKGSDWDQSTQFDVFTDMQQGELAERSCKEVKLEANTYCLANSDVCWKEYDIVPLKSEIEVSFAQETEANQI